LQTQLAAAEKGRDEARARLADLEEALRLARVALADDQAVLDLNHQNCESCDKARAALAAIERCLVPAAPSVEDELTTTRARMAKARQALVRIAAMYQTSGSYQSCAVIAADALASIRGEK
jgi:hypothetical protein